MSDDTRCLGQYSAAAPVLPNGAESPLRVDVDSVLLVRDVSGGGGSVAPNQTYSAGDNFRVLTAAESHLFSITGYNASPALRYLMLFDAAALPAPGSVPNFPPIEVLPLSNFALTIEPVTFGFRFISGIVWAASSTAPGLTVSASLDFYLAAIWKNG